MSWAGRELSAEAAGCPAREDVLGLHLQNSRQASNTGYEPRPFWKEDPVPWVGMRLVLGPGGWKRGGEPRFRPLGCCK